MRIAVTGATGNVGTALLRRLHAEGGHEVVGLVRRPPPQGEPVLDAVRWVPTDLTRPDADAGLRAAFEGADAVVHLAWGFQPSHRLEVLEELGVGGTRRVAEAVRAVGVGHLVHLSSVGAYSPRTSLAPVDEGYPTGGVPTSPYSRHKAAAERLLDRLVVEPADVRVTRLRPGVVGQRGAGSALLRYAVPAPVPSAVLRHVPVVPLDRSLLVPLVHADDLADAISRVLHQHEVGAFNVAAPDPVGVEEIAEALGARHVPVPARVLRAGVAAAWHTRLGQLDPGWIDLAHSVPLLDCSRARDVLGWVPERSAAEVLGETLRGMSDAAWSSTPVLRHRTVLGSIARALTDGPVSSRRRP